MASTYVNDLRLNEMATGDESGNWGNVTNTNLELIGEALGYGTEGITTNADTHTSTIADGATDPVRAMYVKYTGTLDSACTITIAPNTINRMQFIENATSGSQNIIISQGSGANITIPAGDTKAVYLDGAGSGAAVVDAFASLNVVDLKVQDDLTVTDDLIVNGDIDLEGAIDVNGTANLDVVDIDGAVDMASTLQVDGAITSSAGMTITVADNSDVLTIVSTDADASSGPNITLYRNSGSPADSDNLGDIHFKGRNDNSQDVEYAVIDGRIVDASDGTEDGKLEIVTIVGGSGASRINMINTETVFNEDSIDLDFRVESNGSANMFFVDGGNEEVLIQRAASGGTATAGSVLIIEDDDNTELSLLGGSSSTLVINFGHSGDVDDGMITYNTTSGSEGFYFSVAGGTESARMTAGATVFNEGSADMDFRVEGNSDANAFFINGGDDVVSYGGMGTNTRSPSAVVPKFQANSLTRMDSSISLCCNSNDALASLIMFSKTRSAARTGATVCQADDAVGAITWNAADGTDIEHGIASIDAVVESGIGSNDVPGAIRFYTNEGTTAASEHMRLTGIGELRLGTPNDYSARFLSYEDRVDHHSINAESNCTTATSVLSIASTRNTATNEYTMISAQRRGTATVFHVNDAGNVTNTNNSYGAISDQRLKINIADAKSQWDDIKALRIRNYEWGVGNTGVTQLGVISQELEASGMSGLIEERKADEYQIAYNSDFGTLYTADDAETKDGNDAVLYVAEDEHVVNGTKNVGDVKIQPTHSKKVGDVKTAEKVKEVKYSVLYMKAIKALQEAMIKIEALEARVTTLEG